MSVLRAQLEGTEDEELRGEIEEVLERMSGDAPVEVTKTSAV